MTQANDAKDPRRNGRPLLCPSSRPDREDALVFGLVVGTGSQPEVQYLDRPVPPSPSLLALADGLEPTEVFRTTSRCAENGCHHYSGKHCSLGEYIVTALPSASDALPACAIRAQCRWFAEQGTAACFRCPQVVTDLPMAVVDRAPPVQKSRRQLPVVVG